jgi:hypothetical protein
MKPTNSFWLAMLGGFIAVTFPVWVFAVIALEVFDLFHAIGDAAVAKLKGHKIPPPPRRITPPPPPAPKRTHRIELN